MIVMLYTILDKVAKDHGPIFQAVNDGVAKRQYNHLVNSEKAEPSDFSLIRLGEYDTEEGRIEAYTFPGEEVV